MASKSEGSPRHIPIDYVTFRLDMIAEMAKADASPIYEKSSGVSLRELRFLRVAAFEPGLTQSRLAALSYVEKTLVSKTITNLVKRDLLRREISPLDARRVCLYVTSAGQQVVDTCETIGRSLEAELLAGLTPEDRECFDRCIQTMLENLSEMQCRRPPKEK